MRGIEPFDGLVDSSFQLRLVGRLKFVCLFLVAEGVAEIVSGRFKTILRTDMSSCSLVQKKRKKLVYCRQDEYRPYLTFVFLGFIYHAVNLLLGETTLVISDGDAAQLASRLVGGGDVQDVVSINVEGNFNLWNTTRSRRNAGQLKLVEEVVVLGASTLSFVYLNKYTKLVVSNNKDSRAEL